MYIKTENNKGTEDIENIETADFITSNKFKLPKPKKMEEYRNNPPELPDELIEGVLYQGHKLTITGASKTGKSFAAIQLAAAIAGTGEWFGFKVREGRVLYINMELDDKCCANRISNVLEKTGLPKDKWENMVLWNLRGHAMGMDKLASAIIDEVGDNKYSAIIIDPLYKVISGDENSAFFVREICTSFDILTERLGCAVIVIHHHAKGEKGSANGRDRGSGSGVLARDPDALIDIIELKVTEDLMGKAPSKTAIALRASFYLRYFKALNPVDLWFEYPIHLVDDKGMLSNTYPIGDRRNNLKNKNNFVSREMKKKDLEKIINSLKKTVNPIDVKTLAVEMKVTEKTVRNYAKEFPDVFSIKNGIIFINFK